MTKRYALLFFFVLFSIMPLCTIHAESIKADSLSDKNIIESIKEKTPDAIAKPIIYIANKLEEFRKTTGIAIGDKKGEIKTEVEAFSSEKTKTTKEPTKVQRIIKYIELFLLSLLSIIFNSNILFYIVLALVVFWLLRLIWRRIF